MVLYLPDSTVAEVNQGLRKLHDLLEDFDKAEKCGIDCSELRAFHAELQENLTNIKREFDKSTPSAQG